jgi:UDP-glucuronate 4-epimerase
MTVLVTGAAGFIGFHVAKALLTRGEAVCGIDNVNSYYSVALKRARLAELARFAKFEFAEIDVSDRGAIAAVFERHADLTGIIHLAAQAGVRYSLVDPYVYVQANVMGQVVMLEAARRLKQLQYFVYASSSSVYGANKKQPFSIADRVDDPVSLYAATKRAGELSAAVYARLFDIPAIGLRFFTVYGPWGRPDMAAYLFADAIVAGRPIQVFNEGRMARDFTYIDDVVAGTLAAVDRGPPEGPSPAVYNLGNHRPVKLLRFIELIEEALGRKAEKLLMPLQPGDVEESFADIDASRRDLGFEPKTPLEVGIPLFIAWYKAYHGIS